MRFIEALRGSILRDPACIRQHWRNGRKSTLLKLITGIYTPTSGSIQVNGRISASADLEMSPDFSGRENILINGIILGMSRAEVQARMDEIIAFSELGEFIDEPVRTYSSGMCMRSPSRGPRTGSRTSSSSMRSSPWATSTSCRASRR